MPSAGHIIGSHTVDNGGIHMAARRARGAGMTAVQIFTAPPSYYNDKMTIRPERVERFQATIAEIGLAPENVLVHAAYVLSVATPDPAKWERAAAGLTKERERSLALGVGGFCFHPGSAGTDDRKSATKRIAQAIVQALRTHEGPTRVLVENTAGAGKTMGKTAEEVGEILSHVPDELREFTGYGLDTCHLFSSGLDITESPEALTAILDAFEEATGEPPAFFHLNDSEGALGSNKDRHVLLGDGQIGVEPFRWLLADPRSRGIPLILETPQEDYDVDKEDPKADPFDLRMYDLLVSLGAETSGGAGGRPRKR